MSDNRLKPKSALESHCHSRSLFGPLQAIPGNGTTEIVAKDVIRNRTTIIRMLAITGIRAATTRTRPAIIALTTTATATIGPTGVGATTTVIIDAGTMASRIITVEGSKRTWNSKTWRSAVLARARECTAAALHLEDSTRSKHRQFYAILHARVRHSLRGRKDARS